MGSDRTGGCGGCVGSTQELDEAALAPMAGLEQRSSNDNGHDRRRTRLLVWPDQAEQGAGRPRAHLLLKQPAACALSLGGGGGTIVRYLQVDLGSYLLY